jgi:hypothetical protein
VRDGDHMISYDGRKPRKSKCTYCISTGSGLATWQPAPGTVCTAKPTWNQLKDGMVIMQHENHQRWYSNRLTAQGIDRDIYNWVITALHHILMGWTNSFMSRGRKNLTYALKSWRLTQEIPQGRACHVDWQVDYGIWMATFVKQINELAPFNLPPIRLKQWISKPSGRWSNNETPSLVHLGPAAQFISFNRYSSLAQKNLRLKDAFLRHCFRL